MTYESCTPPKLRQIDWEIIFYFKIKKTKSNILFILLSISQIEKLFAPSKNFPRKWSTQFQNVSITISCTLPISLMWRKTHKITSNFIISFRPKLFIVNFRIVSKLVSKMFIFIVLIEMNYWKVNEWINECLFFPD